MCCKSRGIILPAILIFICILSALIVLLFQLGFLNLKTANLIQQQANLTTHLENVLQIIEMDINKEKNCYYLPPQGVNYFFQKTNEWWQQNGCKIDSNIYYVVEILQSLSCVYFSNQAKPPAQAIFYRITAKTIAVNASFNLIIQSVYVEPLEAASNCVPEVTVMEEGRQSLRL